MKTIPLLLAGLTGITLASEAPAPGNPPQGLSSSDWSSIRAAYEAGRHAVHRQENGTLTARNPGQQWRTEFDGKGFTVTPDHGQWTWGLELTAYGERSLLSAPSSITHDGGKISCQRDENLTEWFINDTRGLEQGWTIHSRSVGVPPTSENLCLTLAVRGDLRPHVLPDSTSVSFQTPSGASALTYGGLKAWDADGKSLAVRFEEAGKDAIRIAVDEKYARYPITIDPIAQQAYLKAGNNGGTPNDQFGTSVSVSGDTVVIGAPYEDSGSAGVNGTSDENALNSGAAYVFVRSGTNWTQQAFLKASNTGAGDLFGTSVAVSGDTVVVGAPEEDSSATGVNGNQADNSAGSSGAVYVFVRSGSNWSQQAYLKPNYAPGYGTFGSSVAVSADTVVVGARNEGSASTGVNSTPIYNLTAGGSGAAFVFFRIGSTWSQQAYLKASNTGEGDNFGTSVTISGDTVVVGAPYERSSASGVNGNQANNDWYAAGAAYVFFRSGTSWSQQAYLKASNTGDGDLFGYSVASSGNTLVVGAVSEDSEATGVNGNQAGFGASDSGAAYVFTRSGTTWSQQAYLKASNTGPDDRFGYSVAVSVDTVVVGAIEEDSSSTGVNGVSNESGFGSGAAYVFIRGGSTWSQQAFIKASNTGSADKFGNAVAIAGDTVIVGAFEEDGSNSGVNSTPFDNFSNFNSGAGYVFTRSGTSWSQQAYFKASNTPIGSGGGDQFGHSIAISGDTLVVGAPTEDSGTTGVNGISDETSSDSGAAYVFVRSAGVWTQQAYLKASNTGIGDNFGQSVALSGDTLVVGANLEDSNATGVDGNEGDNSSSSSGAAYVFVRSGSTWTQQAYLKASNTGSSDRFGFSVAVSGNTVVVGAPEEDSNSTGVNANQTDNSASSSGAAYVYTRNGTSWSQQAYLKASNTGSSDNFGYAVSISGETVAVGAHQEDSIATGVNGNEADNSVSSSGAVYVFVRSVTSWSQQAYLKSSNPGIGHYFGNSVSVSGSTLVAGAYGEKSNATGVNGNGADNSANFSGAAYVFVRTGGIWSQQAYLKASNTGATDYFGWSVAISGNMLAVGALNEDSSTSGLNSTPNDGSEDAGAAYVFVRSGTTWSQQAYLKASNTGSYDNFGYSIAVSADTVVVGSRYEDSSANGANGDQGSNMATDSGASYVFTGLGPVIVPPEIAIQAGTDIISGTTKGFGPGVVGTPLDLIFTISNIGAGELTLTGTPEVALSGSGDFIVTAQPSSSIIPSGSSNFTVRFNPTGSGLKTASLSIDNNDADENPFVIELTGTALSFSVDTDNDGLSDASEFNMAALGFDWQVNQTALVSTFFANAAGAGLFTAGQIQAMNSGTPLIARDPGTGKFKLTLDWKKSTNLTDFADFPAPPGSAVSINPQGDVEFEFPSADNAAFFRIEME
jgi:hypothetical protein